MKNSSDLFPVYQGIYNTNFNYNLNAPKLRERFEEDGYLYVPGILSQKVCEAGLSVVKEHLRKTGVVEESGALGLTPRASLAGLSHQGRLDGVEDLTSDSHILELVTHSNLNKLLSILLFSSVRTYDYKWLRVVSPGEYTGAHTDSVYVGQGSNQTITSWIPFMNIPIEMGGLVVCERSHKSQGFEKVRRTYGQMDVDRDNVAGTGWLSEDPEEILQYGNHDGQWVTTDFNAGDIVLFGLYTFHASGINQYNNYRITCDTRWIPEADHADSRWVKNGNQPPPGHPKFGAKTQYDPAFYPETLEQAKKRWGLS